METDWAIFIESEMDKMFFRELKTDRLYLKNISPEDREFVFAQFSNEHVNQFLFDAEPLIDIHGADEIIDFYITPEPRLQHRWILIKKDTGIRIGTCGFHCWDQEKSCCDIGYDLFPNFWGNGFMEEAMRSIISFARNDMDVKNIYACIYSDNRHSIKLAEKLGFVFKGNMKDEIFRGKRYPHKIFTLDSRVNERTMF